MSMWRAAGTHPGAAAGAARGRPLTRYGAGNVGLPQ